MRISLQWLNELVNIPSKIENFDYLLEKLTLGGFEVEEVVETIIYNKKDVIFDITATANRSDSLSVKGIAKEVSALLNKDYKVCTYSRSFINNKNLIKQLLLNFNKIDSRAINCSVFFTITVENFTISSSPKWMKQKLISAGIEPLNNLLDFQNYILLETGYPFEFYDLNKIKLKLNREDFTLTLGQANTSKHFIGTNGSNYKLTSDILLVKSNDQILSIAGIIPNDIFQYTEKTKSLLIEGSVFNSKKIRQTSRILGLRTERSARYEKSLNPNNLIESFWRLLYLLKISNNEMICKIHTIAPNNEPKTDELLLSYNLVTEVLGPVVCKKNKKNIELQPIQISNYLTRLNFEFIFNKKSKVWKIVIPTERAEDITRPIDVIEEIGRLHGFNNFTTEVPKLSKIGTEDFSYQIRKKITSCFLNEGLNEVIHYSLINNQNPSNITIINPLLQDCSTLRATLLINLLNAVSENLKQGNLNLEAFEYGHVFKNLNTQIPLETEQVAGIFGGIERKTIWSNNSQLLSWFEAKGKLENVFKKLNLLVYWRSGILKTYEIILHSYRTSILYLAPGVQLGIFGQIHPTLAKKLNISSQLYLFEFNFEILKNEFKYKKLPFCQVYSSYPKIAKDLSFILSRKISFDQIKNAIFLVGTKLLVSVELLDEYKGESIPKDKVSLCIQLIFQSDKRTLVNKEIEKLVENIKIILIKEFNIIFRV